jgi:hypothetical protein
MASEENPAESMVEGVAQPVEQRTFNDFGHEKTPSLLGFSRFQGCH